MFPAAGRRVCTSILLVFSLSPSPNLDILVYHGDLCMCFVGPQFLISECQQEHFKAQLFIEQWFVTYEAVEEG